jgi:hypothetical protein
LLLAPPSPPEPSASVPGAAPDAPDAPGEAARALRQIAAPPRAFSGDARAEAAARAALGAVPGAASLDQLRAITAAFRREPAVADRMARDAVAQATDAAAMHATFGALFDGLGDPARARGAWQAAVDASAEPRFIAGLAEAQARQGDGDAALITATRAAAASGDPAVVWTAVARALRGAGRDVHALEAARSAIDLAGPDVLAHALDVAIDASRALGRHDQSQALAYERARVAPDGDARGEDPAATASRASDPTDAAAALAAHRVWARAPAPAPAATGAAPAAPGGEAAPAALIDRLWRAARWNPRDVDLRAALLDALALDDPRRGVVQAELVELAGDRDLGLALAAASALR